MPRTPDGTQRGRPCLACAGTEFTVGAMIGVTFEPERGLNRVRSYLGLGGRGGSVQGAVCATCGRIELSLTKVDDEQR